MFSLLFFQYINSIFKIIILTSGSLITGNQRKMTIETTFYYIRYSLNAADSFRLSEPDGKLQSIPEISSSHQLLVLISQKSQRMGKVPGNVKQSVVLIFTKDERSKLGVSQPSFSTELF